MLRATRLERAPAGSRTSNNTWLYTGIVIAALVGLLAPLVYKLGPTWDADSNTPQLELVETEVDLGSGDPNEIVRGFLVLRNVGTAPLEFSTVRSCGCTELRPTEGIVPVSKLLKIAVGVQLPDHSNSEKDVRVTIRSNDPKRPAVHCRVQASCPAPFRTEPTFISFNDVLEGYSQSISRQILIKYDRENPQLSLGQLQIDQTGDFFYVERQNSVQDHFLVDLSLKQGLPPGSYHASLKVRVKGSDHEVVVPINARVNSPIAVIPSVITLAGNGTPGDCRAVDLLIIDRRPSARASAFALVSPPPGVSFQRSESLGNSRYRVRISISDSAKLSGMTELHLKCKETGTLASFKVSSPSDS